jgi:nucleotide-binding universal stress UspA family protein
MSIFPTKILLATDASEEAELARTTAVDEANSTNSELHVVTVGPWSPDPAYAAHEASFRWQKPLNKQARRLEKKLGRY